VLGWVAPVPGPGIELLTAQPFARDGIGVGSSNPRGFDGLVGIDGHLIGRRGGEHFAVMIDHPLPVVVFALGDDAAYVACF
jgi:hypothetical protein